MVITVVAGTMLMLLMGLAIDVGLMFREKRRIQSAADAAATAAALDYHYNHSTTTAQAAGQAAATINGFTNDSANCPSATATCVTINLPPATGPNHAYGSFAEAIVKSPRPALFMGFAGIHSVDIYSRAVAGNPAASKGCGYTGTLKLKGAYSVSGSATGCGINFPAACGISVSSTASNAVDVTGNGGCFHANYLNVAGGLSGNHNTKPTPTTTNLGKVAGDPFVQQLSTVPQPSGGCTSGHTFTGAITITTANQATYSDSHNGDVVCFTGAVTFSGGSVSAPVTLAGAAQGVLYVFENGVTLPTNANVQLGSGTYDSTTNTFSNTSGATMEIYGGSLSQASNSVLSIYAPTYGTNGTTNAIAIWQPKTNTNTLQVQFGSNNQVMDGFIYAPGADVTLHDNGGGVTAAGFVSASMTLNSSSLVLPSYNDANAGTTPLTQIVMVE
jgi:hypothetical protein